MNITVVQRATILTLLAVTIAVTRLHHFATIPDASWAVFFVGGFYLREWTRWAFPALMALAVLVDWLAISAQGFSFWQHYCVSPAYWCLVPAHAVLWAAGLWLRHQYAGLSWRMLGLLVVSLLVSVPVCHLIAQGSFYWVSDSVASPTLAGWWKNYTDWLLPYLQTTSLYVATAAAAHVAVVKIAVTAPRTARTRH